MHIPGKSRDILVMAAFDDYPLIKLFSHSRVRDRDIWGLKSV